MDAFVLIVWILTATGPVKTEVEFEGRGRQCERAAMILNVQRPQFEEGIFIGAECVHRYDV